MPARAAQLNGPKIAPGRGAQAGHLAGAGMAQHQHAEERDQHEENKRLREADLASDRDERDDFRQRQNKDAGGDPFDELHRSHT